MRRELYIDGKKVDGEFKIRGCLSESGKLSSVLVTVNGTTTEYKKMAIDFGEKFGMPLTIEELLHRFSADETMKIYLDQPVHRWN